MRSSWKILAAVAAGLIVAPQFAAADEVNEQLKQMQERMSQLENRLQATTDQLEVTSERAAEQQEMLEQAGVAEAKGSQSGLASFFDSIEFGGYVDTIYTYNINKPDGRNTALPEWCSRNGRQPADRPAGLHGTAGRQRPLLVQPERQQLRPERAQVRDGAAHQCREPGRVPGGYLLRQTARILNQVGTGFNVLSNGGIDTKDDSAVHVSQAYAQYLVPYGDITLKAGKFFTLIGAEVVESPYNYNISRSILFFNVPFEHLGVLAEKKYDNGMTWALGAVNGWDRDNGADFNKSKSLLGRVGWQGDNYGALLNMIYGAETPQDNANKRGLVDLVFTANPIEELSMYLNFDLGWQDFAGSRTLNPNTGGFVPAGNPNFNQKTTFWWGVALAGRYAITDRLGFSLRGEYFQDDRSGYFCTQGATYPGNTPFANCATTGLGGAGAGGPINLSSTAYEATATLDYALTSNLTARAEFRADWVTNQNNSNRFFRGGSDRTPIGGLPALQSNQQTVAAQLYYRF